MNGCESLWKWQPNVKTKYHFKRNNKLYENSLAVQWLGLCDLTAEGLDSTPWSGNWDPTCCQGKKINPDSTIWDPPRPWASSLKPQFSYLTGMVILSWWHNDDVNSDDWMMVKREWDTTEQLNWTELNWKSLVQGVMSTDCEPLAGIGRGSLPS